MKKFHSVADSIACAVAWGVGLTIVVGGLSIIVAHYMVRETVEKASDAVRQTIRPTCTRSPVSFPGMTLSCLETTLNRTGRSKTNF